MIHSACRMLKLSVLLLIFTAVFPVSSQAMTMKEAVETALSSNPRLNAARSYVSAAQSMSKRARGGMLPEIEVIETFSRTNNPAYGFSNLLNQERITVRDFDPARLNNPDAISNYQTTLRLRQPIFSGGRIMNEYRKAEMNGRIRNIRLTRAGRQVALAVTETWLKLRLLKEKENVLKRSLSLARETEKTVEDRVEAGLALETDLLDARINSIKTEKELEETVSNFATAMTALRTLLGVDGKSAINPEFGGYDSPEFSENLGLEKLKMKGLERRTEIKEAEAALEKAALDLRSAKGSFLPEVGLLAEYNLNQETIGSGGGDSWNVGITASMNLYKGGRQKAGLRAAAAQIEALRFTRQEMENRVKLEIEKRYRELETARRNIETSQKEVALAEASNRIMKQKHEQGLATTTDLLRSEVQLKKAGLGLTSSRHDLLLAKYRLDVAAGGDGTVVEVKNHE